MNTETATSQQISRLDSLRALAVVLVLAFHLQPKLIPWGYIGVDVFFSLSGFLMTTLYLRMRAAGQYMTPTLFLAKRFWRIYPSLAIVTFASLLLAVALMTPSDLVAASWSGIAALASYSNFSFFNAAGYFDSDAIIKPLLHTWSLGVEWQYYAFFALALALARFVSLRLVLAVLLVFSLISFAVVALSELNIGVAPIYREPQSALFFLPQYRAFQFAAGGLAAFILSVKKRHLELPAIIILFGAALSASGYISGYLYPLLTTLAVVMSMLNAPLLDRIGQLSLVQYVAKTSYQLYLVHWPVIVFWQYVTKTPLALGEAFICLLLSFILGDLLYRVTTPQRVSR